MNKEFYESMPAMRYWDPKKEMGIQKDILEHPEKYSEYIGSFKKDGEWSKVIIEDDNILIQSRSISKKTGKYTEKQDSLPHLVEEFKKLPKNTVILGEICFDDLYLRSKDVGSILRSLTPLALEKQKEEKNKLHFYCFDVLVWDNEEIVDKGFEERISYLSKIRSILGTSDYIRFANIMTVDQIVEGYNDYLEAGGEGFVLQKKSHKYEPGKRTAWETIKLKKCTDEIELPVVGIIDPEREYTGKELDKWEYFDKDGTPVTKYYFFGWKAGVIVDFKGVLVRASSGTTDDDAQWLSTDQAREAIKNHILYAKIEAMEIEPESGSMRHPRLVELRMDY